MKRIKLSGTPHPSYDLVSGLQFDTTFFYSSVHNNLTLPNIARCCKQDNDGYVSQQDYKLAKRFDFDGNGVLDADERQVGKRVLAEEFFKRHTHDLHIFGPKIASSTHSQNVDGLVNSYRYALVAHVHVQGVHVTDVGEPVK